MYVNPVTGAKTPFAQWVAGYNDNSGYVGYNGRDEIPLDASDLHFALTPGAGSAGNYTFTLTLSSPDDGAEWARLTTSFQVVHA